MRLQDALPRTGSRKRRRRVGRGISAGQGASCGKGMRGQKSRSGRGTRPGFEGGQMPLYRRIPKLSHFQISTSSKKKKSRTEINVGKLSSLPPNTEVSLSLLMDIGIVTRDNGPLKVLGDGKLSVPLVVKASSFTTTARNKIEEAGGACEIDLSLPTTRMKLLTEDHSLQAEDKRLASPENLSNNKSAKPSFGWIDTFNHMLIEREENNKRILENLLKILEPLTSSEQTNFSEAKRTLEEDALNNQSFADLMQYHPSFKEIQRNTDISFPSKCLVNQEAELRVSLTLSNIPGSIQSIQEKLLSMGLEIEHTRLHVYITAPNFNLPRRYESINIPLGERSKEIIFEITPIELGQQVIEVEFFNRTLRVGYALVETSVVETISE